MIEVKADSLEASFEALKEELALLKKRVDEGVIATHRPALDGVKSAASSAFVEGAGTESRFPRHFRHTHSLKDASDEPDRAFRAAISRARPNAEGNAGQ